MRQVLLNDVDITSYIIALPSIEIQTSDYGQLSITNMPVIVGDNRRGFFDVNDSGSPFFGAIDYSKYKIEIIDQDISVFLGSVEALESDNTSKKANITVKSTIQRALEQGLIYSSADLSNPAESVREICNLYKIPINVESFGRSSNHYNENLVATSGFFRGEGTLIDGIQQIAEIGCARVYIIDNELAFDVFMIKNSDPIATFSDDHDDLSYERLYSHIDPQNIQKEPITGYKVEWVGGLPATFGDTEKQGKTISATYSSNVRVMTLQSAIWIGEKWLEYFSIPQNVISFRISSKLGRVLKLNYPIAVRYKGKTTIVDIVSIDNSSLVFSQIRGQTR